MPLLQLCRRESNVPESISGVAVNKQYIAAVRSSGIVEIFSNPYLFRICSIDIGMRDIQSAEFDEDTLLIGSLSEGISYIDMNTFAVKRDRREGVWKICVRNRRRIVVYSLTEGGSELCVNGEIVYRSIGYIVSCCFGQEKDSYLVGTQTGRFLHIRKGKAVMDLPLSNNNKSAPITEIACIVGNEYAVTTMEGELYIIDISSQSIKQTISVRSSSINGVCPVGDRLFMIGADSRLICYSKTSRYYAKECQHDFHVSDGLFIREIEGNIVTVSEDGTINICNVPKVGKPASIKRYQDLPCSYSSGKMYTAVGCEMEVYDVSEGREDSKLIFKHITKDPIISIDTVENVSVIRTKEGIRAYEYNWQNSTVTVKKHIKGLILYHTVIEGKIWYVVSRRKIFIGVSEIEGDEVKEWALEKIGVDYIPSHISKGENESVLVSGSGVTIFNFITEKCTKISDKDIRYFMAVMSNKEIHCAGQANTTEIVERSVLSVYSEKGKIEDKNLSFRMPVIDMREYKKSVFSILQHQVRLFCKDTPKRKVIIGPIVDGVRATEKGLITIQRPWPFIRQRLPLQVLKEKYGRK